MKRTERIIRLAMINLALCLLLSLQMQAQKPVIKASIDSTQILIGEQTQIHLEIAAGKEAQLQLPLPADTLIRGIEVLGISAIDTTDIGNNRMLLKYDLLVTSFDSALYLIPPFVLIERADTAYSNELALKVSTLPVDTESGQFYDIKDVITPKFVIWDYAPFIIILLVVWLLAAIILYIVGRLRTKKSLLPFKKEEVNLPPHVIALKELDTIKGQKLWQSGKTKEYHSEITDTLRKYIEKRFPVSAMEMTSGEILSKLKGISDADAVFDHLKQTLIVADFVKFAKYQPLPDENELSLMNAYLFVNGTKREEAPVVVNEENEKM
jgi:hypothetical protein